MHMADALLSPMVGGIMWAATAGLIACSSRKASENPDTSSIPLMGILGAFVFAAQMINFSIPGTGSSGHLGGGMLLSVLLGPHQAFLTMASILTVQALFFADGGLLALGCNAFNLGFFTCFVAYPLIYRPLVSGSSSRGKRVFAAILSSIIGLQLGSLGVVAQTTLSGISDLPFKSFLLLMQPIHLAIGLVEGLVTATVIEFILRAEPGLMYDARKEPVSSMPKGRRTLAGLGIATVVIAGFLSWFASSSPDGLEWSIMGVSGKEEVSAPKDGIYGLLSGIQEKTAFMPDYDFSAKKDEPAGQHEAAPQGAEKAEIWPAVSPGTSTAGLLGGFLTLTLTGVIGFIVRKRKEAKIKL